MKQSPRNLWIVALALGAITLFAAGCKEGDDVDPAIRESARKQRESARPKSDALAPGQPGAPPAGTNPNGSSPDGSRPR
ncbi:MAG: hypothetical protein ACOYON_12020 [Fimbriimonas sp.]